MKKNKFLFLGSLTSVASIATLALSASCTFSSNKKDDENKKPGTGTSGDDNASAMTPEQQRAKAITDSQNALVSAARSAYANSLAKTPEDKKTLVVAYSNKIAESLKTQLSSLLQSLGDTLPVDQVKNVATQFTNISSVLNDVLADILSTSLDAKNSKDNGLTQVKSYLTKEKLEEINNKLADILNTNAEAISNIGKSMFETLMNNDSTKNISVLDNFIQEMTKYFKEQIPVFSEKAKQLELDPSEAGYRKLFDKYNDLLKEFKAGAVKKAHELLPDEADYNAVKAVLKDKYVSIETSIKESFSALQQRTLDLASLIDQLKPAKESSS